MRRYEQTGRNSWAAKSGYKHSPDVPGPLSKERNRLISFDRIIAIYCIGITAAVIGYSIGWLP